MLLKNTRENLLVDVWEVRSLVHVRVPAACGGVWLSSTRLAIDTAVAHAGRTNLACGGKTRCSCDLPMMLRIFKRVG